MEQQRRLQHLSDTRANAVTAKLVICITIVHESTTHDGAGSFKLTQIARNPVLLRGRPGIGGGAGLMIVRAGIGIKQHSRTLACVLAALGLMAFLVHGAQAQSKDKPWVAIERIILTLQPSEFDAFVEQMVAFSSSEGFQIKTVPPKGSHNINFIVRISPDAFLYVSNFSPRTRIQVAAYSEDPSIDWRPPWQRLIEQLRLKFKDAKILVEKLNR
jgi:hypothetical protein